MKKIFALIDRHIARKRVKKWEPPKTLCGDCGQPMNVMIAYDTGDGWLFGWECKKYCGYSVDFNVDLPWPWLRDWVYSEDWQAIGVTVI